MLVDKTPWYAMDPAVLARAETTFEDALYIHLMRHPYGMIHSFEEAKLHELLRYEHPFQPRELAELTWTMSHANIHDFLQRVPSARRIEVRYEDLVRDPRGEAVRLCEFLGIEFEPALVDPYAPAPHRMTDGPHRESQMLGDVKFLQHGRIDPTAADRWRRSADLTPLGEVTWERAQALGYAREDAPAAEGSTGVGLADELLADLERLSANDVDALLGTLRGDDTQP
jgi:hypothetical protein